MATNHLLLLGIGRQFGLASGNRSNTTLLLHGPHMYIFFALICKATIIMLVVFTIANLLIHTCILAYANNLLEQTGKQYLLVKLYFFQTLYILIKISVN